MRLYHRQKGDKFMDYGKKGVRTKQKALNSKSVKWGRKIALTFVKVFLIAIVGMVILGTAAGIGMFKGIINATPSISLSALVPSGQVSIIFDNKGNEIDRIVGTSSNRIIINDMSKIPKNLSNAFVAIEDERFYEHNGIDIKGLFRAGYWFLRSGGHEAQGASTITQQLLKNAVFTDWTSEGDNFIKKVKRKLQEQFLAIEVTKKTTKDEVLLQYMNTINLGQNTLGVEAASQRYFGKSCSELTLSECAVIASITQNPTKYNPIKNRDENKRRRKDCLDKMLELEFVSQQEYDEAIADTETVYDRIGIFNADYKESTSTKGTYFSDAIQKQVLNDLIEQGGYNESMASNMLYSGGLRIFSTLDPDIQAIVDEECSNEANFPEKVRWYLNYALTITNAQGEQVNYSKENMMAWFVENVNKKFNLIFNSKEEADEAIETYKAGIMQEGDEVFLENITLTPQPQISVSVIDQNTGYVVALIGGRGAKEGRLTLNRATSTVRPPGSTFKVLAAYAPALDSAGLTLASVFEDKPFSYDNGRPVKNWYKTGYKGIVPVRYAIQESMNIIAVKALTQITPQLGYDYLLNFGFTTLTNGVEINGQIMSDINQPLALGGITYGVTNVELCEAYATIANGGAYIAPKLYSRVEDADGNILLDNTTPETRQVIKPTTAYLLTDAMVDVVTKGTGASVNFGNMAMAGKTGTTTDSLDVWFAGFTPYYTACTWTGYDNNEELNNSETGISKKLWRAIMSRIHENLPNAKFETPDGITSAQVCALSGKLPIPGVCDTVKTELFAEGTIPSESCDVHYQGPVCVYDNLPATPECPFAQEGATLIRPLVEDPSLWPGSTVTNVLPDGTTVTNQPQTANYCQHDATFFANPDYETVISQQQQELSQRAAAAGQPPAEGGEEGE